MITKINRTNYQVARYVPRPNSNSEQPMKQGPHSLYPFNLMVRGDSFEVPSELSAKMKNAARMYAVRNNVNFELFETLESTRIWRIR